MSIHLPPDLEARLHQKIARGDYTSLDRLLSAALDALERDEQQRSHLAQLLQAGVADIEASHYRNLEDGDLSAVFAPVRHQQEQQS